MRCASEQAESWSYVLPAERAFETVFPRVPKVAQRHLERVGDASTAAVLDGARREPGGELDHQPVATDRTDRLDREPVLPGEQLESGRVAWTTRDDEPRWPLTEQVDRRRVADADPDRRTELAPHRALGERDGKSAPRDVLGRRDESTLDRFADECLDRRLAPEIEAGWVVLARAARECRVGRAGEPGDVLADDDDGVVALHERWPDERRHIVQQPDDTDLGCRRDRARR